ncbi:MAG: PAS domain S-box protein, partial [Spirochaetaceae bacterium]|nr:PAS domain S-box protein [Spirochaetaceae bacterium]
MFIAIIILQLLLLIVAFFVFEQMYKTRIKLESTLLHEQKNANKIFDLADVIIVNYNSKGIITEINKRGCEILGYSKNELIGKNWFETVQLPENIDIIKNKYGKIIKKEIQY